MPPLEFVLYVYIGRSHLGKEWGSMSDLSLDKLLQKAENKLQDVHEIVQEKAYELIGQAYKESI